MYRCTLWLKSVNIGASPRPSLEPTLAQCSVTTVPASLVSLLPGEFHCCAVGASLAVFFLSLALIPAAPSSLDW